MTDTTESTVTESAPFDAQEASSPAKNSGDARAQTTAEGILPADHWTQAPLDGDTDADSAVGDFLNSTHSITSTIMQYRTLHGRTYHTERGNAQYWGANDEAQMESMDIAHHAFTLALNGKLYLAPLKDEMLQKALDVGTGTGI